MNLSKDKVYLLYAVYPCLDWRHDRHGNTPDCSCDWFLESVFTSPDKAKAYIPQSLNEAHADLDWQLERPSEGCFRDEYSQVSDSLVYLIREHNLN